MKALVKATEILPDLNQINHIFMDKTGTLTKNKLIFKHIGFGNKLLTLRGQ